jgi:hypothetical protein
MRKNNFFDQMPGLLITLLLLTGCSGTTPGPAATTPPISPTATLEPTTTPTSIPSTATSHPTAIFTATLPVARATSASAEMPRGPGVEWHLAIVSESSGWGLGTAFASQIEKDMGVKVVLNDMAFGGLAAAFVLDVLKPGTASNPNSGGWSDALKNADVIILAPGPLESIQDGTFMSIDRCFGNSAGIPESCPANGFDQYTADLEAIWAKILELRSGKPTILRGMDYACPFVQLWREKHIFDPCTVCWEASSAAARRAADSYHIPFLSRYDIYNGVNHDQDVGQQGYIGSDGIHPNSRAQERTAELLAQLGYEAVIPP